MDGLDEIFPRGRLRSGLALAPKPKPETRVPELSGACRVAEGGTEDSGDGPTREGLGRGGKEGIARVGKGEASRREHVDLSEDLMDS